MKRIYLSILLLVLTVTFVVALSVAAHRHAGQGQTANARRLRDFYSRVDPPNKPAHAFLMDLLIPAAICGLMAGLLLARWPRFLFVMWLAISLVIVMLWPIYHSYIDGPFPVGWSLRHLSFAEGLACWFAGYVETALLCGLFTYVGWAINPHRSGNTILWRSGRNRQS